MNHAYEKSKFLRGARIDESKIQTVEISHLDKEKLSSLIYVNPSERRLHFLDKVISFDPEQKEIYLHSSPLIIIGPAGSGKTALILERIKLARHVAQLAPSSHFEYRVFTLHLTKGSQLCELRRPGPRRRKASAASCGVYELMKLIALIVIARSSSRARGPGIISSIQSLLCAGKRNGSIFTVMPKSGFCAELIRRAARTFVIS